MLPISEDYNSLKLMDDVAFFNIENYTETPVVIKNNRVVTSKGDRLKHGYVLLNVKKCNIVHQL